MTEYGTAPSVLLIDDDDAVAVSLRHYLRARGCDVDTATSRAEAEARLDSRSYDLIVVDPYMTGEASRGNGTLLRSIRSAQPDARLVLVSAYASSDMFAAGVANRAVAVLTKPQSVIFLSQLVISALKARMNLHEERHH